MDDLRLHSKYSRHTDDAAAVFACIPNLAEFYDEKYQGGQEMLLVLNEIFADFAHQLASVQYREVEKIKSNGACFMVASGLNMTDRRRNRRPDTHLHALIDFALDPIHTLDDFNWQIFNFQFEMKVGYNIGEVTVGVIGTTKLLYDIWVDKVNVASRMYSTGQKGRIQVTEAVGK
ncbi:Adenylate cyclase [Fasciola gigantica]|uniref:adenylate cyclase n=1 Tax=Fasciola gigantica TaxID=46835 RepID=A0A504YCJ3_FASGI|nr:Adenylate cyclase [Fasciola gigantica]